MSELDTILQEFHAKMNETHISLIEHPYAVTIAKIEALIESKIEAIIGEDEKEIGNHGKNEHITIPARNNLRVEQFARAKSLGVG